MAIRRLFSSISHAENINLFTKSYPALRNEFVSHVTKDMPSAGLVKERIVNMLDYNCLGGKLTRGVTVMEATRELGCEKEMQSAVYLGWCIEILQAMFLVSDDIMDQSVTRRGKPCWYKLPGVKFDAINDSFVLESFMHFILRSKFQDQIYLKLSNLYLDVNLSTQLGQMLDLDCHKTDPNWMNSYSLSRYYDIVTFKTAFYTFYLPLASAMIVAGRCNEEQLNAAKNISVELGKKFQIQDDFLDCFGDPKIIGKVGTDIKDHKCSWLVVNSLNIASPSQKEVLKLHYGKKENSSEMIVKNLFKELKLDELYESQERDSFEKISQLIRTLSVKNDLPESMFKSLLKIIHNRIK